MRNNSIYRKVYDNNAVQENDLVRKIAELEEDASIEISDKVFIQKDIK